MNTNRDAAPRYAVIDVETTGFSRNDRIVEVACVTVTGGEIVDEYDTLVQPERDPGPVRIHGITPTMLQSAPPFAAVAADIAMRLDGAILVAHNISFDVRFLSQEIERLDQAAFDPGVGVCTYRLTGLKLAIAAERFGTHRPSHSALDDARAALGVFSHQSPNQVLNSVRNASFSCSDAPSGLTIRRPEASARRGSLGQVVSRTDWPHTSVANESVYLDVLDRCLDDGILEPAEQKWLDDTAFHLGLSEQRRLILHTRYYDLLTQRIVADGIVTESEQALSENIARILRLDPKSFSDTYVQGVNDDSAAGTVTMRVGDVVCFTGASSQLGIDREQLVQAAQDVGLTVASNLTKKCSLLVAADPLSQSGKAKTARKRGIPMIDIAHFLNAVDQLSNTDQ